MLGLEVARLHSQGTSPKHMPIAGCIYGQPNYTVVAFVLWVAQGWPNATRAIQNCPCQRLEKGTWEQTESRMPLADGAIMLLIRPLIKQQARGIDQDGKPRGQGACCCAPCRAAVRTSLEVPHAAGGEPSLGRPDVQRHDHRRAALSFLLRRPSVRTMGPFGTTNSAGDCCLHPLSPPVSPRACDATRRAQPRCDRPFRAPTAPCGISCRVPALRP